MGIIGALYERARCRSQQEIQRRRRPWNPTLQKTKGAAPGTAVSLVAHCAPCSSLHIADNPLGIAIQLALKSMYQIGAGAVVVFVWPSSESTLLSEFISFLGDALLGRRVNGKDFTTQLSE